MLEVRHPVELHPGVSHSLDSAKSKSKERRSKRSPLFSLDQIEDRKASDLVLVTLVCIENRADHSIGEFIDFQKHAHPGLRLLNRSLFVDFKH